MVYNFQVTIKFRSINIRLFKVKRKGRVKLTDTIEAFT